MTHQIIILRELRKHPPARMFLINGCFFGTHKRICEWIAFSMHFAAYVASLLPRSGWKVFTALIRPIVPTDKRSSVSYSVPWYFLTTCATSLRFRSIRISRASRSPSCKRSRQARSSPGVNGFGNVCKEKATLKHSYDSLCSGGFSSAHSARPSFYAVFQFRGKPYYWLQFFMSCFHFLLSSDAEPTCFFLYVYLIMQDVWFQ